MRILLVCSSADGGHYNEYKTLLTKTFSELGHEVLHFYQSTNKSKKVSNCIPAYARTRWQIRLNALANWHVLFDYLHQLRVSSKCPDLLFFTSLDELMGQYLTTADIDRHLNNPFSGLLFSPPVSQQMSKKLLRPGLFNRYNILKSKWCRSIGLLFEEAVPIFNELIHKPVYEVPDVISLPQKNQDNSLGRHIRGLAGSRFIIGIWGALELRKGISEFLQMPLLLPSESFFFVMGGKIHDKDKWTEIDRFILNQSKSGIIENLLTFDQWLRDDELLSGILSCDLIFAAYPGFRYTSGIVGKAAALGIPVLVNDGFVMAKRVKDYTIGFVKPEKADIVKWVSGNMAIIKEFRDSVQFKEGCLKYCDRYGYEQWRKSLKQLIEPIEF